MFSVHCIYGKNTRKDIIWKMQYCFTVVFYFTSIFSSHILRNTVQYETICKYLTSDQKPTHSQRSQRSRQQDKKSE